MSKNTMMRVKEKKKGVKRQATESEKIFITHTSGKGLTSRKNKELLKLNMKNTVSTMGGRKGQKTQRYVSPRKCK